MRLKTKVKLGLARTCGAYARSTGMPCQCKRVFRGGRCKLHGGLSTGPKTLVGKKKAIEAMRRGWLAWRARLDNEPVMGGLMRRKAASILR